MENIKKVRSIAKKISTIAFALILGSCVSVEVPGVPETIHIHVIGGCPGRSLPGAVGKLVNARGSVVTTTKADVSGLLKFSGRDWQRSTSIVVCYPDYFCATVSLADPEGKPGGLISLAQIAVY